FLWQLVVGLISFAGFVILVLTAAAIAFGLGWLRYPREHVLALVLSGLVLFAALAVWFLGFMIVQVLTKDFVVPQMALDNVGPVEGWRRLWTMMETEKARFAGYLGLKILLRLGSVILIGIAAFIVVLAVLVPVGIPSLIAFLVARAAGIT